MRILVTGSHGFIASFAIPCLAREGHEIVRLVRRPPAPGAAEVQWDPAAGTVDAAGLEGLDAVIHLAGENVDGRWTPEKKVRIYDSRVMGTRVLCEALSRLERPPGVLLSTSAIGYYGNRGDEALTEESSPGSGFFAAVCRDWEAATQPAADAGIRVATLRFGLVLSATGGALPSMLPPFRLGLGGKLGSGRQWMSWIVIDDVAGVIQHLFAVQSLRGPVNAVAPNPVTNAEFTRTLGKVLARPTPFRVPAFALRLAFGEIADAALLSSARVVPERLLATGYAFRFPDLEGALRHVLGRSDGLRP